jgi:hypothetical protein
MGPESMGHEVFFMRAQDRYGAVGTSLPLRTGIALNGTGGEDSTTLPAAPEESLRAGRGLGHWAEQRFPLTISPFGLC